MPNDLKLTKKYEDYFSADYTYDYMGYRLEEHYLHEEDCDHHGVSVYLGDEKLAQFDYGGCLEDAMDFVDGLIKEKKMKPIEKELKDYDQLKEDYDNLKEGYDALSFQYDRLKYEKERLEKAFDALSKDDEKAKKELSKEIEKNRALDVLFKYITIGNPFGDVHYIYLNDESEMIMPEDWEIIKGVLL